MTDRHWRQLAWLQLLLLAPIALFPALLPAPVVGLAMATLLLPLYAHWRRERRPLPSTPLTPFLLLLLLLAFVSTVWRSPLPAAAWPKLTSLLWSLALYWLVVDSARTGRAGNFAWLTRIYFVLGAGLGMVGLLGMATVAKLPLVGDLAARLPALTGGMLGRPDGFQANEVAGMLTLFVPLAVALLLSHFWGKGPPLALLPAGGRRRQVAAALLLALFLTGALLLTQSRGGLLGLGGGVIVVLILAGRRGWLLLGMGGTAGAVTVGLIGPARLVDAFLYANASSLQYGPLGLRLEIWRRGWLALRDHPFIGVGLGTFRHVLNVFYPWTRSKGEAPIVLDLGHAHNLFLQTGLDLGWLGALVLAIIFILALLRLVQLWRQAPVGGADRFWVAGATGALLAHLVFNLADALALGARPGFTLWFLLGLIMGVPLPAPETARRHRAWYAAAALLLAALLLPLLRPEAWALNAAGRQAAAALLTESPAPAAAASELAASAMNTCQANYYLGVVGSAAQRASAWTAAVACDPAYLPYMATLAPADQALAAAALAAQPGSAAAYYWLGETLSDLDPDQAARLYLQGLELDPDNGQRWLLLGDLLADRDAAAAIAAYGEACAHGDPGANGCWRAGRLAEQGGDVDTAIFYYRQSRLARAQARAAELSAGAGPSAPKGTAP